MASRPSAKSPRLEPTLTGSYYCDTAVLEREREAIFRHSWLCAGREERLPEPGDFLTLELATDSVLIVRGRGGARAFHNVCRHRGARLCDTEHGRLKGSIHCPYHAWTYGLDGRLVGTPNLKEGEDICREEFSLHAVDLESWGGFLFVRLAPGGESLLDSLGEIAERARRYPLGSLRVGARKVDEVQTNWKILVENYMECYHCPGIHPELCDLVPLYRTGQVDHPDGDTAVFRPGAVTFTIGGTTRRPFLSGLSEEDRQRYNGELVLPNMFLNLFPDYVHTRTLWPLAPGRTRIVSEWLFEPGTMARPDFDPSDAVDFLDRVGWQDWKVCEAVQKGVASRAFGQGVYAPQEEYAADFKRWLLERLESAS